MPVEPTQIQVIKTGPVTHFQLNGYQGLNLLSVASIERLLQVLTSHRQCQTLQVLILSGSKRAFCAGADMNELLALKDIPSYIELGQELTQTLENYPVPVIAAIDGHALGAGFSLALACDFRVISTGARLGQLAVRNGLIPPFGNIQRLLQICGPARGRELILTGRILTAEAAFDYQLADKWVTGPALEGAMQLADELLGSPRHAVIRAKEVIQRTLESGYAIGYAHQENALADCLEHPESRRIMQRFLDKSDSY